MTRVECLYRVSTKGQVDHDDIPMQRIACRRFAQEQGWTIIKELQEKGVSGFKVSANDRDAIQELREDAMEKRFDVLLVFMFDRLGRRDDETPFVVEWFAKQGIRIFSAKEGEQKFECHTDSLVNYIRFWQSKGESMKTAVRIKTRLDQLRAEGVYTGGPTHYGYRAVEKGRLNKKGKPVKDLEIDPAEAAVVREIFDRTVYHGEGSFTLANDLNARGYRTKHGKPFQCRHITSILQDKMYIGYIVTKDITSPFLPELQIIDEDTFAQAGTIVEQRKRKNAEWRNIPRQTGNGALLAGNLYCADCGSRMTSSVPAEGAQRSYAEYICYKGANHRVQCNGQKAYVASRVDEAVLAVTAELMQMIREVPKDEALEKRIKQQAKAMEKQVSEAKAAAARAAKEQEALEMEVGKCLLGQSKFSEELLSKLISDKAQERKALQNKAAELEMQLRDQRQHPACTRCAGTPGRYGLRPFLPCCHCCAGHSNDSKRRTWSGVQKSMEFQLADTDRKRLIISQLYSRIEIGRGYELRFVLDANYQQFLDGQADTTVSDFVAKLARKNTVPYMAPAIAPAAPVAMGA